VKIDYDPSLYRQIANFPVNEIVRVANRKGRNRTIHITNIVKLSWLELQLLVPEGADRFSKMVILFNKLSGTESLTSNGIKGESLSAAESCEVDEYIRIFKREGFSKHTEVNDFISKNELWNNFKTIRSLNDHGKFKEIEGIQPKYFEVICHILNISDEGGLPLDSYTKY
jgi:hypothetical protein